MEEWVKATVVENRRWNKRLCSLRVIAEKLPEFRAGQFVRLGLEIDGKRVARPYSLVNAPGELQAEFYFNKVDEGPLSPRLHSLESGDKVWLSTMVAGFLTLDDIPPGERLWMLATGTALGPFLSMLKTQQAWQQYQKIILVHGVRSADELAYGELIEEIKQLRGERFLFVPSVTRETVANTLTQRIPAVIANGELENLGGGEFDPDQDRVMLCGNPGMVEGCVEQLGLRGLTRHRRRNPGQVVMEIYK